MDKKMTPAVRSPLPKLTASLRGVATAGFGRSSDILSQATKYRDRPKILFLSPVQPLLTPGRPLPRWQMQASWVRALGRRGHEVKVVKYTPDDRIRLNWGERVWWNFKVLSGSSSMTSKMASSARLPSFENASFDLIIYSLGADVLLPQTLGFLKKRLLRSPRRLRNDGVKLVVLSGVSPIRQGNPRERAMAALVDLAATNDEGHAREWLELGAKRAAVLPIAGVDPELHFQRFQPGRDDESRQHFFDTLGLGSSLTASSPLGQSKSKVFPGSSSIVSKMPPSTRLKIKPSFLYEDKDIDVLFIGTLTPQRREFFDKLRKLLPKKIKMVVKELVWEEEYAELMSRAKIGINLLRLEMEWGVNLRAFEIPAFGAMEITSFCRKEWLTPGKEVEVFGSAKEAAELVKKYLKDDGEREKMAEKGRRRVMREHTFDRRAEKLMEMVDDDPRRHFFDTLGLESSLTSSSPLGWSPTRVLSGSSSMVSKMPPSDYHGVRIDVSVCIINYKVDKELGRCVESIKKFTKEVSYEIIAVDNSKDNRWYPGGNNLAVEQAGGRYVLFLNPDCWLENDAIAELVNFMDKHPKVGAAEPRQVYENGEIAPTGSQLPKWWIDAVEMTGLSGLFGRLGNLGILGRLGRLGKFGELDKYRQIQFDRKKNFKTDVISGAAMMVRKEILDKIGEFDERLKLYYTDVDLCRRISRAGWEIWHAGEILVRHTTRASTSKLSWKKVNKIYAEDAREYYRKWGQGIQGGVLCWMMIMNRRMAKFFGSNKVRPSDGRSDLSAVIIASGSEDREKLKTAIESVGFADEVLVEKIVTPIRDFSKVRNEAMERAKGEWVMFVDSDEEITPALAGEIQKRSLLAVRQGDSLNDINGFYLRRRDRFLGKWLNHGETASVRLLRLARRGAGRWERPVHEVWKVGGKTVTLMNPISHYSHESVAEMLKKLDDYSTIEADYRLGRLGELGRLGKLGILGEMAVFPAGKFIQNYFWRLGVLDGMEGFIHALMMAGHSFLVRAKLANKLIS